MDRTDRAPGPLAAGAVTLLAAAGAVWLALHSVPPANAKPPAPGPAPAPASQPRDLSVAAADPAAKPTAKPAADPARGSLDLEIIRRVISEHLHEVRFCYESALAKNPNLAGRVVVQFTIAPTGDVVASQVLSSTLAYPAVESCIASALRRWQFPRPQGGGSVTVSYPFVLKAGATQ